MKKSERDSVFISYCHADLEYLEKMKRHFSIFRNKIEIWDDNQILAGEEWRKKIEEALSKAKVAIFLVSADFFSSEFITEIELPSLLKAAEEEGAIILSLIVKPCLFSEYSELNKFQTINPPNMAISQMTISKQEETFVKLALRLKDIQLS